MVSRDYRGGVWRGRRPPGIRSAAIGDSPADLVPRLSQDMTLQPGDVILCRAALGVLPMKPMKPGQHDLGPQHATARSGVNRW